MINIFGNIRRKRGNAGGTTGKSGRARYGALLGVTELAYTANRSRAQRLALPARYSSSMAKTWFRISLG